MDGFIAGLFALFLVLVVVTLVGHGLWVLIARILGGPTRAGRTSCPRCYAPLRWQQTECDVCRWPARATTGQRSQQVHAAVHRLLYRFRELGVVDDGQFRALLQSITEAVSSAAATPAPPAAAKQATAPVEPGPVVVAVAKGQVADAQVAAPAEPVTVAQPLAAASTASPTSAPAPPVLESVEQRASRYAARREEAANGAAVVLPQPPQPPRQQALGRLIASFLEEKNIRWGELVGGLLIICCSIALVISFWAEIAERPWMKFGIFNGVSAALFGVGFYTDRRWKIHTTSHGVLIIAMLLVPLNFLAIAAFTAASPPTDLLSLAGEVLSLALFASLCYWAARVLTPQVPWATASAVMLPAGWQLLVRRIVDVDSSLSVVSSFAIVPLAVFAGATSWGLARTARDEEIDEPRATRHGILLALGLFAALLCLALILHRTGEVALVLRRIAPLLVFLGAPLVATGFVLGRRIAVNLAALRTASVSVGALGAMIMVAAVVHSWPMPWTLVTAAGLNAAAFVLIGQGAKAPTAGYVAAACLAVGWLVGGAVERGAVGWTQDDSRALTQAVVSADSGASLAPFAAVLAAVAYGCRRRNWKGEALIWGQSAGAAVVASVALLAVFGLGRIGDPANVLPYFVAYAIAATAVAVHTNRKPLAWVAMGLVAAACIQALVFRFGGGWADAPAWCTALLAHATATLAIGAATERWWRQEADVSQEVFAQAATVASALGAAALVIGWWQTSYQRLALEGLWLALVWLALAWRSNQAWLFTPFQAALALALCAGVLSRVAAQPWYQSSERPWLDPWFAQAVGVSLAIFVLAWHVAGSMLRRANASRPVAARLDGLLHSAWPRFDRICEVAVVALAVSMAIYAVVPGSAQELSPVDTRSGEAVPLRAFEFPYVPSTHASGMGGWLLWACVAAALLAGLWAPGASLRLCALLLLGAVASLLAAAHWLDERAVASATRWSLAVYALAAAAALTLRGPLRTALRNYGVNLEPLPASMATSMSQAGRAVVVGSVLVHYLAIALFVSAATIVAVGVPPSLTTLLRWLAALAVAAGVAALVVSAAAPQSPQGRSAGLLRTLLILAGVGPLGVAAAFVVTRGLVERPLLGPDPSTWFAAIRPTANYGGPLALLAAVLLVFALRERSSRYAFSFGLLAGVLATLVYLLEITRAGRPLDAVAWVEVAQLNGLVTAVCALAWWGALAWNRPRAAFDPGHVPQLLATQSALSLALCWPTFVAGCLSLFGDPTFFTWQRAVASPLGLVSVGLALAALALVQRLYIKFSAGGMAIATAVLVSVAAMIAVRLDTGWQAYRTLMLGTALGGWVMVLAPPHLRSIGWAVFYAVATSLLALRYGGTGPWGLTWPWLVITMLLAVYGLTLRIAWLTGRRRYVWWSGATLAIAAIIWFEDAWQPGRPRQVGLGRVSDFVVVQCLALALSAIASVVVEWSWTRGNIDRAPRRGIGFHRFAIWAAIGGLLVTAATGLIGDAAGAPLDSTPWLALGAVATVAIAVVASLWDENIRWTVAALYTLGLAAVATFLNALDVRGEAFEWSLAVALAAFLLASSYLWSRRAGFSRLARTLGAPMDALERSDSTAWMVAANGLLTMGLVALVWRIEVVSGDFTQRMTTAYALLAAAFALALLVAGGASTRLRYGALAMGALFAVAFGWAWVPPNMEAPALHRLVACVVALAAVMPAYAFGLVMWSKQENQWTRAAQRTIPWLAAAAALLLLATLGVEAWHFRRAGVAPLTWPALVAVVIALAGTAAAALCLALLPGRDPLGLSDRGRMAYVYAAEVILGLLFAHVRMTMPWLFGAWFQQYWPLVVVAIAFFGVGLSELLRRQRQHALAEPLENTGALLPLLPVLGYWLAPAAPDYAHVLLGVGALYTVLSVLRKSPMFAALAILAVNGSLWSWLHSTGGLGLLQHPQLWLVPPLACVLIAAHLNRDRLSKEQLTSVRYFSAVAIYASSTADIFINGVGRAPWLPLVLAGLSIAGIFAGIMLRVRAFLFLGFAFLVVSLLTVIWHAAVELDHTWVWWVSGIVTGAAIIALFGLFEKKRNEMLRLVEQVRQWDG